MLKPNLLIVLTFLISGSSLAAFCPQQIIYNAQQNPPAVVPEGMTITTQSGNPSTTYRFNSVTWNVNVKPVTLYCGYTYNTRPIDYIIYVTSTVYQPDTKNSNWKCEENNQQCTCGSRNNAWYDAAKCPLIPYP